MSTHAAEYLEKELSEVMLKNISATELSLVLAVALEIDEFQVVVETAMSKEGALTLDDVDAPLAEAFMLFDIKSSATEPVNRLLRGLMRCMKWDVRELFVDHPFTLKLLLAAKHINQAEPRLKPSDTGLIVDTILSTVLSFSLH